MQDIHSIAGGGGGAGRLFAGGGGGDRRLRTHHHHQGHGNQALKCPRCDSLNTKFCYYNNYNLSQPRHFCKSCRRYWTKGGVLRNVPVGGGCRKAKRSKQKASTGNPSSERKSANSQNSSSDSSSLTATTTAVTTTTATEVLSGNTSTNSASTLLSFPDSSTRFFGATPNASFDPPMLDQSSADKVFPEIGTFSSLLMTSSTAPSRSPLGFNTAADISSVRFSDPNPDPIQHQWMQEMGSIGLMDPTAQIEFSGLQNKMSNDGLATEDWEDGTFDLTGAVDQAYWNHSQWNDEHHLNFLP